MEKVVLKIRNALDSYHSRISDGRKLFQFANRDFEAFTIQLQADAVAGRTFVVFVGRLRVEYPFILVLAGAENQVQSLHAGGALPARSQAAAVDGNAFDLTLCGVKSRGAQLQGVIRSGPAAKPTGPALFCAGDF